MDNLTPRLDGVVIAWGTSAWYQDRDGRNLAALTGLGLRAAGINYYYPSFLIQTDSPV